MTRLPECFIANVVSAAVAAIRFADRAVFARIAVDIPAVGLIHASTILANVVLLAFAANPTTAVTTTDLVFAIRDAIALVLVVAHEPLRALAAIDATARNVLPALHVLARIANAKVVCAFFATTAIHTALTGGNAAALAVAQTWAVRSTVEPLQIENH